MKAKLKRVHKERDILLVSTLAHEIWREYYPAVVSSDQVEYMLEKFQSPAAIKDAIAQGYEYYLVRAGVMPVGYVGIHPHDPPGKLFLSKYYMLAEYRGKGYGRDVMEELTQLARGMRARAIWLTVNKKNTTVEKYRKLGFEIVDEMAADIGGGYVMNDYIMEKAIDAC